MWVLQLTQTSVLLGYILGVPHGPLFSFDNLLSPLTKHRETLFLLLKGMLYILNDKGCKWTARLRGTQAEAQGDPRDRSLCIGVWSTPHYWHLDVFINLEAPPTSVLRVFVEVYVRLTWLIRSWAQGWGLKFQPSNDIIWFICQPPSFHLKVS